MFFWSVALLVAVNGPVVIIRLILSLSDAIRSSIYLEIFGLCCLQNKVPSEL
jgi:hypothetical protein